MCCRKCIFKTTFRYCGHYHAKKKITRHNENLHICRPTFALCRPPETEERDGKKEERGKRAYGAFENTSAQRPQKEKAGLCYRFFFQLQVLFFRRITSKINQSNRKLLQREMARVARSTVGLQTVQTGIPILRGRCSSPSRCVLSVCVCSKSVCSYSTSMLWLCGYGFMCLNIQVGRL